jgi:hypothetical protein
MKESTVRDLLLKKVVIHHHIPNNYTINSED